MIGKNDLSPIFIVGSPRSGTTLLRLALNNHSRIAIPEETWFIPILYKYKDTFIWEENWKKDVAEKIFKLTRIHFPEVSVENLKAELESVSKDDWPSIMSVLNRRFARVENKSRWGDKTPGYVVHLPLIKKLYPNAKIIHIIRDGRDVVPSILKHWSVGPQIKSFIETAVYWKKHVVKGIKDGPEYFKENYMEVRYEALVTDPESELRKVCNFICEDYEPEMLNSKDKATKYTPEWEWHKELSKPIDKNHIELWKKKMSPYQITLFNLVCGDLSAKLNYPAFSYFNIKAYSVWASYRLKTRYKTMLLSIKVILHKLIVRKSSIKTKSS